MTEYSEMVEEARREQAFAKWTLQPTYLYMDTKDGILVTKYNDGHIWYDDHGKNTYSYPDDYQKESFWKTLRHRWGGD